MSRVGRILCVGTTPALQRVMVFNSITSNAVNRAVQTHEVPAGKSVNVAKVLHTLGLSPAALGFLGGL
ncbi:MAG: 1-phosphofructokinase, partial [Verrucomicrobiota bacterium]